MIQQVEQSCLSAAVFCPQNKPPKPSELGVIRRYLLSSPVLTVFQQAVLDLPKTWQIFADSHQGVQAMQQGHRYTQYFRDWLLKDDAAPLIESMSGIITLPMLTIIQIVQYFQYLETRGIDHGQFLSEIHHGGTQGFCAGLLPVMAIAPSSNEAEVIRNAATCLRIALGIGAYGELGDDQNIKGPTTLALRLQYQGQAEEIVSKFRGTYISAVSDPTAVSIVGPTRLLSEVKEYAESLRMRVSELCLRGKVHNPENDDLCRLLCELCDKTPDLLLPESTDLRVPVRSNATGELLGPGIPLAHEIVKTALVFRCEWYTLLENMASALCETGRKTHRFAMFGTSGKNCVGQMAFDNKQLKLVKHDVLALVAGPRDAPGTEGPGLDSFPADSIAIVGAACRLPGARSLDQLWGVLSSASIKATKMPTERVDPMRVRRIATATRSQDDYSTRTWYGNFIEEVDAFDNSFFNISSREALYMDPQQRALLETAYEALDESGYLRNHRRENFDRVGCFLGSTYTEYLENTTACSPTAYTATGTIRAFQSGKISHFFGWSGPSEVVDTACSSSLVAIHRACRAIQGGECPMALAGGVNIITGMHNFLDLDKSGFLSTTGQCKPFDVAADGYCRADGAGLVVLKSLKEAVASGDNILGVIPGVVTNHGGLSPSITVPYSNAQTELFRRVLTQSGMRPSQISYIEAHGTGTQVGDPIEMESIREVFGKAQREDGVPPLFVGSIKANVGHSETAAGVGSLMKVLAMLQHSKVPPMAGFQALNPKIPPLEPENLCINTEVLPWEAPTKAALVNSYGAAGSNSALVCCEAPKSLDRARAWTDATAGLPYPIFLSAATIESLERYFHELRGYLMRISEVSLRDLSFTLYERRKHHPIRWAATARNIEDLIKALTCSVEDAFELKSARPSGSENASVKPVVLVFSGQNKQTIELAPSLYRSFPAFRRHLQKCNEVATELGYSPVLPFLFSSEPIADIVALQCGTFAVQYACARTWLDAGLEVAAVVGHSFGELTALAVAEVLSLRDAVKLVAARASLMQTKWGPERGTMLAVQTTSEVVEGVISRVQGVEIACSNGPQSQVIVGTATGIAQAEVLFGRDGVKKRRLDVTHGFHSAFTECILGDLEAVAKTLQFRPGKIRLETCTEFAVDTIRYDHIVQHTRNRVHFDKAIRRLEDRLGPCVWLESGCQSPIMGMTKKAVENPTKHTFIPFLDGRHSEESIVGDVTTMLWHEGLSVSFWGHLASEEPNPRPIWLPPYQFQRNKHWLPYADYVDHGVSESQNRPQLETLVTPRGQPAKAWDLNKFEIHPTHARFADVVSCHAVRGQPLCPASMYMECALAAANITHSTFTGTSRSSALHFENLHFHNGLGLNPDREIILELQEGKGSSLSWDYTVNSLAKAPTTSCHQQPRTHATGSFSARPAADWHVYSRVVAERARALRDDPRADRMSSHRAYALFARVVQYGSGLRGIEQVFLLGTQGVAEVRRPRGSAGGVDEEAGEGQEGPLVAARQARRACDAVCLDMFIQVAGLLVNTGDGCPDDEVYIATQIDSVDVQDSDFRGWNQAWTVYVMASEQGPQTRKVRCDVLVLDGSERLVVTMSGVQFGRHPIAKLEKALERAGVNAPEVLIGDGRISSSNLQEPFSKVHSQIGKSISSCHGTTSLPVGQSADQSRSYSASEMESSSRGRSSSPSLSSTGLISAETSMSTREKIVKLVSENSGSRAGEMAETVCIQDVGIDSLSLVELRASLEEEFGIRLSEAELDVGSTLDEIFRSVERGTRNCNV